MGEGPSDRPLILTCITMGIGLIHHYIHDTCLPPQGKKMTAIKYALKHWVITPVDSNLPHCTLILNNHRQFRPVMW